MLHESLPNSSFSGEIFLSSLDKFCRLFSHRWHFITRSVGQSNWTTETRYPIKPANLWHYWKDPNTLIGLRFGQSTRYALLDLDRHSPYHPENDPTALSRIRAALEGIGLYRTLLVQSSESGGLHLYLPLPGELPTYDLALCLRQTLEEQEFCIEAGTLEIFPNTKSYRFHGVSNYNGHRLPLQANSYLLNDSSEVITNDIDYFFQVWDLAESGNDESELLTAIASAKQIRSQTLFERSTEPRSERAKAWKADSERVIEAGWTGKSQTNELLGTIAEYGVVFKALSGDELYRYTLETAIHAPGYEQFCRHQREIEQRCRDWSTCAERHRKPYKGFATGSYWNKQPATHNRDQVDSAIARIRRAVDELKDTAGDLINRVKDWAQAIAKKAQCSLTTLYKNKSLWYGLGCNASNDPIEASLDPPPKEMEPDLETLDPSPDGELHPTDPMKVDRGVTTVDQDLTGRYIRLTPSQFISILPMDTRRAPFCDRSSIIFAPYRGCEGIIAVLI
jgi:hypothetical protein